MPKEFKHSKVLVVGDVMLDRYYHGSTSRISPEAPVPIVHVRREETRVGGAANVAVNLSALAAQPTLIGFIGNDNNGKQLDQMLMEQRLDHTLLPTQDAQTITKLRIISQRHQMLRLDFEDNFRYVDKTPLRQAFTKALDHTDCVILSDYGKGTLSDCQTLITQARQRGIPVYVDPKGNDFSLYAGATIIKPNLQEFLTIVGECPDDATLVTKANQLIAELAIEGLLITRGGDGMVLVLREEAPHFVKANSSELVDVTGAGDTVIATFAAALSSGYHYHAAMLLANLAASIAVSKLGTSSVTNEELTAAYRKHYTLPSGVVDRETLAKAVREAQEQGKTVVMTNGCFDLLHAGHVAYLKKAKTLGDRLIVAVNDDASIRRLKGPGRPVAPQTSRMEVLAALEAVDWVVPFHEDTPEELLHLLKPDILVKGTDYQIHEIVGADIVFGYGGQVQRIAHEHQDISTTQLIRNATKQQD